MSGAFPSGDAPQEHRRQPGPGGAPGPGEAERQVPHDEEGLGAMDASASSDIDDLLAEVAAQAESGFDADESDAGRSPGPDGGLPGPAGDDELSRLTAERDEYLDTLRRLQADFDNFRKRALRQQTELLDRGNERLMRELLPVLDALDLAMAHAAQHAAGGDGADDEPPGDDAAEDAAALIQVGTLLRDILRREGLERIDQLGVRFDPTVHDAVAHEPPSDDDSATEGPVVADVLRAGYRLKGLVVRPAMVKVRG